MGSTQQVRATAARLRKRAEREGWSDEALVDAIVVECGVSPLAAHRHARGWTAKEVASALNELRGEGEGRVTTQMVSRWEQGAHAPKAQTIDQLCRLYRTRPDRLGLGGDYSTAESPGLVSPVRPPRQIGWRTPRRSTAGQKLEELMPELDHLRRKLGATLRQELSETVIDFLERRVRNYHAAFAAGTSASVIVDIPRDLAEAWELLQGSHNPDVQTRILTVIAQLSGMLGIALCHLGDAQAADEWLNTGQLAAEQTGNRELRAWITARQALVPLYYGNGEDALRLADQALSLAGSRRATAAGARAATIRARVLSQRPAHQDAALAAAEQAQAWHAELDGPDTEDGILGLTPVQLASYLGEVYANIGDEHRAAVQHDFILGRSVGRTPDGCLEPDGCLDPTLSRLNMARCHIHGGEVEQGCAEAAQALLDIPEVCCTLPIIRRAREVARLVPERARRTPAWRELRDVLAFHSR